MNYIFFFLNVYSINSVRGVHGQARFLVKLAHNPAKLGRACRRRYRRRYRRRASHHHASHHRASHHKLLALAAAHYTLRNA